MKNLSRRQWCIGALALLLLVYLLASGLAGTGLAALTQWLQQAQRLATGLLQRQLVALRSGGAAAWGPGLTLLGLAYGYGLLHALGAGHGKLILVAHLGHRSSDRPPTPATVLGLCLGAALLQGLGALLLVGGLTLLLRALDVPTLEIWLQRLGALLLLAYALRLGSRREGCCSHGGALLAMGLRPCSGSVLIFLLAVGWGLTGWGLAAVLAIALGVATTTTVIGLLTLLGRRTPHHHHPRRWPRLLTAGLLVLLALALLASSF